MNYRIVFGAGVATLALLITGLALGTDSGIDSTIASTTSTEPVSIAPNAPDISPIPLGAVRIVEGSSLPFKIGDAGTVIVGRAGDLLMIVSAEPHTGWTAEIRIPSGPTVAGVFWKSRMGVGFTFTLDQGVTRVRIEGVTNTQMAGDTTSTPAASSGESPSRDESSSATTEPSGPSPTRQPPSSTTQPPTTAAPTTTAPTTTTTAAPTTTTAPTPTTAPNTTTAVATTTTTTEAEVWTQIVIPSAGGSIVVSYRPGEVRLDAVSPAPTFVLEDVDEDPKRVQVELKGDDVTYTLEVKWERGELVTDIDASGPGAD